MNKDCPLCNGTYDFRRIQISETLGEKGISLTPRLNTLSDDMKFKFCPLCGSKLTAENFADNSKPN